MIELLSSIPISARVIVLSISDENNRLYTPVYPTLCPASWIGDLGVWNFFPNSQSFVVLKLVSINTLLKDFLFFVLKTNLLVLVE